MSSNYDHKEIEKKWQKRWADDELYKVENTAKGKENFYTLVELPYPSGDLHVGHWSAFAVPDIFARMKRMQGYNSLYPIGFDAFGLPAENAAIKHGADPAEWTLANIDRMRNQLKLMGNMFDWDREMSSCDPKFYKWTQWLFLQLYNKGLAYKGKSVVNWDPVDQTVLANEQVLADGTAERSGAKVEKRELEQWFLKITDYADRLIDDLDELDWPEPIKDAQRNWIGRSEGAEIEFEVVGSDKKITVFTTRPDTLFGATYVVLAPEHELIQELAPSIENKKEIEAYIEKTKNTSEIERLTEGKEKTGVELKGIKAINPGSKEEIPIFVADYVLNTYGTGAIMAVPAHDQRDAEFAQKYNLPVKPVIGLVSHTIEEEVEEHRTGVYGLIKNENNEYLLQYFKNQDYYWIPGGGLEDGEKELECLKREIEEETGYRDYEVKGRIPDIFFEYVGREGVGGRNRTIVYNISINSNAKQSTITLTDSEVSDGLELRWVSEDDLEKKLEQGDRSRARLIHQIMNWDKQKLYVKEGRVINSGKFDGMESEEAKKKITEHVGGRMTKTYRQRDWLISRQRYWGTPIPIVYDPDGKAHAVPEEHLPWLLPTDVDFIPTGKAPLARSEELKERTEKIFGKGWTPEIDTMDVFMDSSWYFLRYLDPNNEKEFCSKDAQKSWMPVNRYSGGAEHTTVHILYSRFFYKALYDLGLVTENEPYKVRINRGLILAEDGRKMSKRWGNTVNPDEHVANVGADSVKMYLAFIGPYNEVGSFPWNTNGLIGVRKFLERVWSLKEKIGKEISQSELEVLRNQTIKKVGEDIESMKFNTSVSALMIYSNELQKAKTVTQEDFEVLLRLLAPFAPHMTEELWEKLGHTTSIHLEEWPEYDPKKAISEEAVISVQIGGKMRGTVTVNRDSDQVSIEEVIKNDPTLSKYLDFKPSKVIFVPNKIINFVL